MKPPSIPKVVVPPVLPDVPAAYDWEAFRQNGYKVVDFIVDYNKSLQSRSMPVCAKVEPGFLARSLQSPPVAPEQPAPFDSVMRDVQQHVMPGMMHWQHPDFYAFFPCQASPPAMLGEMMANAFNQPGFNWMCSPAASELEIIVTDWITNAFGLPDEHYGWRGTGGMVLQPTATEAAVVAMIAARNRAVNRLGPDAQAKFVTYCSDQAHFCIEKACRIVGVRHVRKIVTTRDASDGNYPMTAAAVAKQIELDLAAGLIPFFVSANYGSTGICTVDPLNDIADLATKHNMWYNVDAAYAGVVAICPEMRADMAGMDRADTILVNGHKWMAMLFNTAFMFFRDKASIVASLNTSGVYLSNEQTAAGAVVDFKDYHLGLGRPFRSLKVYTVMQCFGTAGLQALLRRHIELTKYLWALLQQAGDGELFDLPVNARFGLVCFRLKNQASEDDQLRFLAALNESQKMLLIHTVVEGKVILRISLAAPTVTAADMDVLANDITSVAQTFLASEKK